MIPRHLIIGTAVMLAIAVGMSVYLRRISKKAAVTEPASYTQPIAPPVSGPTEQITLYVADDESGTLRAQGARIPLPAGRQERAEELLRALVEIYLGKGSPHALGEGSEVRSVYLVDPGLAVIDMNAAFSDAHRSGVLVEELTVASLVETLSANIPGINRVKILVDGKSRDTLAGHVDLTGFFDVGQVNQVVGQMQ
jgi:hypothetical protein